ncbi:MAG: DUF2330 domain-containing protein [Deltaproteobacteria bacterium]|nr:DUF2330 domain-containing protein [Deltaproteobacteria bacterium]
MTIRTSLAALAITGALATIADPAKACGGCFVAPSENTVVTGHRMALSISPTQSVLWDQIQYAGAPEDFSWVLPVKPGARVELANDAWFEALDAATSTVVQGPILNCGGGFIGDDGGPLFGCGASADIALSAEDGRGGDPPAVTVVHQGTVGPYETVTLSTEDPAALEKWLDDHGYDLPVDVKPTVDAYVKEGFDFIALRLIPGKDVQAMRPVRVVTPGAVLGLPLRMVAAGTGAETAIKLFVIGEGRYQAKGFENRVLPVDELVWDFDTNSSNFSSVRASQLKQNKGKAFLTSYARSGSLLSASVDAVGPLTYNVQSQDFSYSRQASSIAQAYFFQGDANGEKVGNVNACLDRLASVASSGSRVVEACDPEGANCDALGQGEVAAEVLQCGDLDDLRVALAGLHPDDVWVTRLEASLPRAALADDLVLEAATKQDVVEHRHALARSINSPCPSAEGVAAIVPRPKGPTLPGGLVGVGLGLATLSWLARRRPRATQAL